MPAATTVPTRTLPDRTIVTMYVGLALTVLAAFVPILLESVAESLSDHLRAGRPDESELRITAGVVGIAIYLVIFCLLGVAAWLVTLRAVRRQKRWARPVATTLFGVATVLSLANLLAPDDRAVAADALLLPTWIGVLGLLPCAAGVVTTYLLWRRP